jgi:hypothetical protein
MSQNQEIEPLLIDSKELARLIGMSEKWVEVNRHKIIGAQKIGSRWRFNIEIIRGIIATGRDIIIKNELPIKNFKRCL